MKKGDIYEGIIKGIEFPDKGYLLIDERKITIKQALPGQKVRFAIKKMRKGKAEGRLLEVLEASPMEKQEGICPHFGLCGGCLYQSFPYEKQLEIKAAQVQNLLRPIIEQYQPFVYEGIYPSPVTDGYRNKMEFTFGDVCKDGDMALGMHKRNSFYDIVTVGGCHIVHSDFRQILMATLQFFAERKVPYYHRMQHRGYLRHLLIRRTARTNQILVDLVTSSQAIRREEGEQEEVRKQQVGEVKEIGEIEESGVPQIVEQEVTGQNEEALLADYVEMIKALPLEGHLMGILHTVNDSLADIVQSDRTDCLLGQDYITEEMLGLKFKITAFSFFQTNSLGAEVLYSKVQEYVGASEGKNVFDLYSGTGTIAQLAAPVAAHVTGVEIVKEAVEAAKENAQANGLKNCDFLAGDVLKVLDTIEEEIEKKVEKKPDLIILDPPREGIHPKALPKILSYQVDKIVYISCKPTSLARDLEEFLQNGYRVERMCNVDMFPWAQHVETVALLTRKAQ